MMKRVMSFVLVVAMVLGMFAAIPIQAQAAADLKVSDALIEYVKSIEGFRATPYWDHAQWTIGFGSRCPEEDRERYEKEGIPMAEAHALLANKLNSYGNAINSFADENGLKLNQHQFDALVSFTYNLGTAWIYTPGGTMYEAVVKGYTGNDFIAAISAYCNASGEYLGGLMRRRLTEANIYLNGSYGKYAPGNYCNVRFDANGGTTTATAQGYDCNLYATPNAIATYAGYVFQGWYTDKTGGVRVTSLDETTDGLTLYAHWAEASQGGTELPEGVEVSVTGSKVNVRRGPGLNYSVIGSVKRGEKLLITKVQEVSGMLWGKFEEGWLALSYTTYGQKDDQPGDPGTVNPPAQEKVDVSMPQVPTNATVVATETLSVYNGPHGTYPVVGTLKKGDTVVIVEIFDMLGTKWGRFEGGWLKMKNNLQFDNFPQLAHSFKLKITDGSVPARCGPGTDYVKLGTVYKGDILTITAVITLDNGQIWGQHSGGWTRIDGRSDYDSSKLPQYQNHSFGNWYNYKDPTCAQKGQERRDCTLCKHYETRETVYADHNYGAWHEVQAGTCVTPGIDQRECIVCGDKQTQNGKLGNHGMGQWAPEIHATCISEGRDRRDCDYCDYYETRKTPLADHAFGAWTVIQAPTATEMGKERRECTLCGHFEERDIVPTEHVYGEWYTFKAPSCTEDGEARRDCIHCGVYESKKINMIDHSFGEWEVITPATCTEAGEESRKCVLCQLEEKRVVEAGQHTVENWFLLTKPSCAKPGSEIGTCKYCGKMQNRAVEVLPHTYGEWTTVSQPSCGVPGEQVRTCQVCGYEDKQPVMGEDHVYGQWTIITAPSCTTIGDRVRVCENCGYTDRETMETVSHRYGKWNVTVVATCVSAGEQVRSCTICGVEEKQEIAPTDHVYGEWVVTKEPTCQAAGEKSSVCQICGDALKQTMEAIDHIYGEWILVVKPSCTTAGEKESSCTMCGDAMKQTVAPIEHTFGEWTVTKEPTCIAAGEKTSTCKMCGETLSQNIPMLEHTYGAWEVYKLPTCTQAGEARRTCSGCGDYVSREVAMTGHAFGNWQTVQQASCSVEGLEHRECTNCGMTESQKLPMQDHVYGAWQQTLAPTTTEEGQERRDCQYCDHFEIRSIPRKENDVIVKVFATITCDALTIRKGAGTSYGRVGMIYKGRRVEILEQKVVGDVVWGRMDKGWICLTGYTSLETVEENVPEVETPKDKIYATVTCDALSIRKGPGTSYGRVGIMYRGRRVEILEQRVVGDAVWGRVSNGWICLTGFTTLETVTETYSHVGDPETVVKTYATVTCSALSVREGAGTEYARLEILRRGDRVEILDQIMVGSAAWGKTEIGWICLTGYTALETEEEN